ncbi:MAG: hypothetical protein V4713_03855 [Pseudomonadota bacterium]
MNLEQLFHYAWREIPLTDWVRMLAYVLSFINVIMGVHTAMNGRSLARQSSHGSTSKSILADGTLTETNSFGFSEPEYSLGKTMVRRGVVHSAVGLVVMAAVFMSA